MGKPGARFVAKMEDVLDVYARPYDAKHPVICTDECSKELHTSPRPDLPAKPGKNGRQDYEYAREGTRNMFIAVEPLTGRNSVRVTQRRTSVDYAEHLRRLVDEEYADAEYIVLVNDNLNTHSAACLYEAFEPEEAQRIAKRIEWHWTPEHASWLNMAEIELSILSRQCLKRRIPDEATLVHEIAAWECQRNSEPVTINWQFTADDARIKLRHLYPERKKA
ncbi:MAG: IS630 family transposase [Chthonomonadales bacterium]